ncbi:MAG: hypothetical protein WA883_21415 [Phormidesmis sp.]
MHKIFQSNCIENFFIRMAEKETSRLTILASHPSSKARIRKLESLIAERGYSIKEKTPLLAPLIKEDS